MITSALPPRWLNRIRWRACAIWAGALGLGEAAGAAFGPDAPLIGAGLAIFVAAVAGALGGAAIFDSLSRSPVGGEAAEKHDTSLEPSSAWNFDYREAEPDDAWSSDLGRSQVAWAEATLAARDAWERAARNSRTRVVLGKRVILGDPPPRSGDDT
jgi:hypothetical protein